MTAHQVNTPEARWGGTKQITVVHSDGSHLDYDSNADPQDMESSRKHAEGGYVLVCFDIDGNETSTVHASYPGGWWSDPDAGPTTLVHRAATYLSTLDDTLTQIDELMRGRA